MFTVTQMLASALTAGTLVYGVLGTDITNTVTQAMAKTQAISQLNETQHLQIANLLFEQDHGRKATGVDELAKNGEYLDLKTRDEQTALINKSAELTTSNTLSDWVATTDGIWLTKVSSPEQCASLASLRVLDANRLCQADVDGVHTLYVRNI